MTLALPEDHLRWLADADGPLFQMDTGIDVLRQDIPMPEAIGCGWLEIFHLPLDMRLIKAVHRFHPGTSQRLVPLARAHFSFPEPTFMVQAAQQGRFGHQEFYPPCELTFGQGQELFRYADRLETIPLLDTTANSEMISLSIGRNLLHRLLGEAEAEQLLAGLNLSAPPMVQVLAMPRHLTTALHACLSATLTGAAKKLHAQAKVLEYLSQLVQYRSSNSREPALTVRRRDKIHQLREELTCLEGKLPTLDDLALRYGICARTLDNDFKHAFGQSIFAFVTGHRLAQAHALLQESDVPMKQLAARLGYAHVNHFSAAFRRQYGCPPGQVRSGLPSAPGSLTPVS